MSKTTPSRMSRAFTCENCGERVGADTEHAWCEVGADQMDSVPEPYTEQVKEVAKLTGWNLPQTLTEYEWDGIALFPGGGRHRDSDNVELSNFDAVSEMLGEISEEDEDWAIFRFRHWAVGWVEETGYNTGNSQIQELADKTRERLENYPLLDEDRFSELEAEEEDVYSKIAEADPYDDPNRDRAVTPMSGDRTSCRFCDADIAYREEGGWWDRGGNSHCASSGMVQYDEDGIKIPFPEDQLHAATPDF